MSRDDQDLSDELNDEMTRAWTLPDLQHAINGNLLAQDRCRLSGNPVSRLILEDQRQLQRAYNKVKARLAFEEAEAEAATKFHNEELRREESQRAKLKDMRQLQDVRKRNEASREEAIRQLIETGNKQLPFTAVPELWQQEMVKIMTKPSLLPVSIEVKDHWGAIAQRESIFHPDADERLGEIGRQIAAEQRACADEAQEAVMNEMEPCYRWRMKKSAGGGYDIWAEGGPHFMHVSNKSVAHAILAFFTGELVVMMSERREVNESLPVAP